MESEKKIDELASSPKLGFRPSGHVHWEFRKMAHPT